MSLLARSVATLEGIALTADPNYQMVAQVRKLRPLFVVWSAPGWAYYLAMDCHLSMSSGRFAHTCLLNQQHCVLESSSSLSAGLCICH
jgi:hypothetical protein